MSSNTPTAVGETMECVALFVAHSLPRGELFPIVGRCAPIGQKKREIPVDFCVKVVEFVAKVVGFSDKTFAFVSN